MALLSPRSRSTALHIDIFDPESLANLRKIIDIDNQELLVPRGKELIELLKPEGNLTNKEGSMSTIEKS